MQIFRNLTILALSLFLFTSCKEEPPPPPPPAPKQEVKKPKSSSGSLNTLSKDKNKKLGGFDKEKSSFGSSSLSQDKKKPQKSVLGNGLSPRGKDSKTMLQGAK